MDVSSIPAALPSMPSAADFSALIGTGGGAVSAMLGWCVWTLLQIKQQLAVLTAEVDWIKAAVAPHREQGDD